MLVLTRKPNEVICIGDDIRITIVSATPSKVRIGIDAPRDKVVDRLEVYERRKTDGEARPGLAPGYPLPEPDLLRQR